MNGFRIPLGSQHGRTAHLELPKSVIINPVATTQIWRDALVLLALRLTLQC